MGHVGLGMGLLEYGGRLSSYHVYWQLEVLNGRSVRWKEASKIKSGRGYVIRHRTFHSWYILICPPCSVAHPHRPLHLQGE